MSIYVATPRWRTAVSIVAMLLVWIVFVAAIAAIGWWLLSALIDPEPYSDPEAATILSAAIPSGRG
jgi:hypothetical protein